jgi:hypothetical protein
MQSGIKKLTPEGVESTYCGGVLGSTMLTGSCSSALLLWYPGVVGFNSLGELIFYRVNTGVRPHTYVLYKIKNKT